MKTRLARRATMLAIPLLFALPMAAQAARPWILPSATTLNGNESWVTIDVAASDDLFNLGRPMPLDNLVVLAPDGSSVPAENQNAGKQRSSFEVKLVQKGTYKVALSSDILSASYKLGEERKRWRGNADAFVKEMPTNAHDINVSRMQSRLETFVTAGRATPAPFKPSGAGLELVPLSNPTELFVGETAGFRFLLDGKPAANLNVTLIPGGNRYRYELGDIQFKTDADGKVSIKWPAAGVYWLSASNGSAPAADQPAGTLAQPTRRISYAVTLEVLQP